MSKKGVKLLSTITKERLKNSKTFHIILNKVWKEFEGQPTRYAYAVALQMYFQRLACGTHMYIDFHDFMLSKSLEESRLDLDWIKRIRKSTLAKWDTLINNIWLN